jgi:hypothetical protein
MTWGSWSRKNISTGSLVVSSLLRTQSCASNHLDSWTYFWTKIHNLAMKEMLNVQRSNRWSLKQTKGDGSSIFLSEMPGILCSNESATRYPPITCCRNDWESVTSLVVYGNCDWVTLFTSFLEPSINCFWCMSQYSMPRIFLAEYDGHIHILMYSIHSWFLLHPTSVVSFNKLGWYDIPIACRNL